MVTGRRLHEDAELVESAQATQSNSTAPRTSEYLAARGKEAQETEEKIRSELYNEMEVEFGGDEVAIGTKKPWTGPDLAATLSRVSLDDNTSGEGRPAHADAHTELRHKAALAPRSRTPRPSGSGRLSDPHTA